MIMKGLPLTDETLAIYGCLLIQNYICALKIFNFKA